jgi:protein required for attachment to host cells
MKVWILVCDASRARVFAVNGSEGPWTLAHSIEHPESRLHDTELVDGERGRTQTSFGSGARSAMEPTTAPKEVQRESYATQLVRMLDHEYDVNSYGSLVLVAPPHFLGLLRKGISSKVAKRLAGSLDKDYSQLPLHELQPLLDERLRQLHR